MIIGHGDIASVLSDRDDRIYFASGVSNSKEERWSEFEREINLLDGQDKTKHLVYFSSLCVFYSKSRYAHHKRFMESYVRSDFDHYTIIRLGNISWGSNPHTLINFFRNRVKNNEPVEIQDAYRFVIDKDEFLSWIDMIPDWNCEMNCPGRRLKVQQIFDYYVKGLPQTQ